MEGQLSQEAMEAIRRARAAEATRRSLGATQLGRPNPELPPEPPPIQSPPVSDVDIKVNDGKIEEEKKFDTFVELKNLPSKGRFYKEVVKSQPMKVPDLILIQGITESNMTSRFSDIFARRVRGVSALDILLIDEYYISLWMRNATFPKYYFPHDSYNCKKCNFKVPSEMAEFSFNQIEVNTNLNTLLPDFGDKDFIEKELPVSKQIIKIHPKRRLHLARAEKLIEDTYTSKDIKPPEGVPELIHLVSNIEIGPVSDLRKIVPYIQSEDIDPIDYVELIKLCAKYIITEEVIVNLKCADPACAEVTPVKGYPFQHAIYVPIDEHREPETG